MSSTQGLYSVGRLKGLFTLGAPEDFHDVFKRLGVVDGAYVVTQGVESLGGGMNLSPFVSRNLFIERLVVTLRGSSRSNPV